jgi:hypothetical protein
VTMVVRVAEDCTGFEADEKKSAQHQQVRKKS